MLNTLEMHTALYNDSCQSLCSKYTMISSRPLNQGEVTSNLKFSMAVSLISLYIQCDLLAICTTLMNSLYQHHILPEFLLPKHTMLVYLYGLFPVYVQNYHILHIVPY